jgi:hypothetical protein
MLKLVTLALAALGVLAGSAVAAAQPGALRITGPTTLTGPGKIRGALKGGPDAAAVTFTANGKGGIAFVDRKGDLKVECKATGGVVTKTRKNGKTALVCKGDATATGSAFAFAARGPKFQLAIPAGYTGRARHVERKHPGRKDAAGPTTSDAGSSSDDATVMAAEQALADAISAGDS